MPSLPGRSHRRPVTHEVRVYTPLTADMARSLLDDRRLARADVVAFAVTPAVEASDPQGDTETHEWQVMQDAAAEARAAGHPVVVLAADLRPDEVSTGPTGGALSRVEVLTDIPLQRVASLHVGDEVIAGEGSPLAVADGGDSEIELSWYDATELRDVVEMLGR